MARTIPTTIVQAMNAQTTSQVFLVLLEITHSTLGTPVRLVNNTEDITYDGNSFTAFPFSVTLPPDAEETQYQSQITLSNASRLLVSTARLLSASRERAKVKIMVVSDISSGVANELLMTISNLEVANVSYDVDQLTINCRIESLLNEGWPGYSFLPSTFPGIY